MHCLKNVPHLGLSVLNLQTQLVSEETRVREHIHNLLKEGTTGVAAHACNASQHLGDRGRRITLS